MQSDSAQPSGKKLLQLDMAKSHEHVDLVRGFWQEKKPQTDFSRPQLFNKQKTSLPETVLEYQNSC